MRTEEYLAIAFFFMITICFFFAWLFWQRARHRELMLMIEKGMDPSDHMHRTAKMLRTLAIIVIGIGAGAALFTIILNMGFKAINSDGGTLSVFGLSIGIALYFATRPGKSRGE